MATSDPLIELNGVKKVFLTDEVEPAPTGRPSSADHARRVRLDCRPSGLASRRRVTVPAPHMISVWPSVRYADGKEDSQ